MNDNTQMTGISTNCLRGLCDRKVAVMLESCISQGTKVFETMIVVSNYSVNIYTHIYIYIYIYMYVYSNEKNHNYMTM